MKKMTPYLLCLPLMLAGCKKETQATDMPSREDIVKTAEDAYTFGFPLIIMDLTAKVTTNVSHPIPGTTAAPLNQFGNNNTFPDANFTKVVRPNCDTYYSSAVLDLKDEPLVLGVPNTNDRYYLLPILDAYTNVFASPGKRTTGTRAQNFLITGPDFKGEAPQGMKVFQSPTNMAWIIGRTQVNSKADGEAVIKIQQGYKLTPLSKFGQPYTAPEGKVAANTDKTPPPVAAEQMDIETFFNRINALIQENPPTAKDAGIVERMATIGIGAGKTFRLADYDAATQEALKKIPAKMLANWKANGAKLGKTVNGWSVKSGLGNYGTDYTKRAVVSLVGLGANIDEDALYPSTGVDDKGNVLNGSKKYVLHFDKGKTPPANAFWSITVYGSNSLLVANPINRFAIGDRDKLKYNTDGSLDIYIQKDKPAEDKIANWLPSGAAEFGLTMRIYWPKKEAFDGSWQVAAVKEVK